MKRRIRALWWRVRYPNPADRVRRIIASNL